MNLPYNMDDEVSKALTQTQSYLRKNSSLRGTLSYYSRALWVYEETMNQTDFESLTTHLICPQCKQSHPLAYFQFQR